MNPFTLRGPIRQADSFSGRWAELSLVFGGLESRRPVFVRGSPGIGKTSFLIHIQQSAAINLERFDLRTLFLDLEGAHSAAQVLQVIIHGLGRQGATSRELQDALAQTDGPTLLCLDNVHILAESEWGVDLLEELARLARMGVLLLVAVQNGEPPMLSERLVVVQLGAFAAAEVRLFTESYLEGTGVSFSSRNLRRLYQLSQGHPAYLQRAAYHLYSAKLDPAYDWIRAYLDEARDQPIPGAALPPLVFEGFAEHGETDYAADEAEPEPPAPPSFDFETPNDVLLYGLAILVGVIGAAVSGLWWLGVLLALAGVVLVAFGIRWVRARYQADQSK